MDTRKRKKTHFTPAANPYFPKISPQFTEELFASQKILIEPMFNLDAQNSSDFISYLSFIDRGVRAMLPQSLLESIQAVKTEAQKKECLKELHSLLPLFFSSEIHTAPCTLAISLLCQSDFTQGVGRYVSDMLSRWLIPGKLLTLLSAQSMQFQFVAMPGSCFFFHQVICNIENAKDLNLFKRNFAEIAVQLKINITAVRNARRIASLNLNTEEKTKMIQKDIASLMGISAKEFDLNVYDQMQEFLVKVMAEEKVANIKDKLVPLLKRSHAFESDLFHEIQSFVLLFGNHFIASRSLKYLGRLIGIKYILRKAIMRAASNDPHQRHLFCKLFRTTIYKEKKSISVVGVLIAMNVLNETEVFEERHILEALSHCLPNVQKVEDSQVFDRHADDKMRTFYIEIKKKDTAPFSLEEIKTLQKRLPRELKEGIENVLSPIFMPRNEEEVMRNILLLSHELKYVRDIPQIIITFDTQAERELCFTVILLRVLKAGAQSLYEIFKTSASPLKFIDLECKHVGMLRKKYFKEANVFKVKIEKKLFLRRDFSLDIFKARQAVSAELARILGDIRDFNGGIFSKQQEVFKALKEQVDQTDPRNDFLMENFFYSLTPPVMQNIIPIRVLRDHFLMQKAVLDYDFEKNPVHVHTEKYGEYFHVMVASANRSFKEAIFKGVSSLNIPPLELAMTFVCAYQISCLGLIYRCDDEAKCASLMQCIKSNIN